MDESQPAEMVYSNFTTNVPDNTDTDTTHVVDVNHETKPDITPHRRRHYFQVPSMSEPSTLNPLKRKLSDPYSQEPYNIQSYTSSPVESSVPCTRNETRSDD